MRLRNITHQTLEVADLGGRLVAPDEVIDVPDDLERVWPETVWAFVAPSKSRSKDEETSA